jgi:hypothetical protein
VVSASGPFRILDSKGRVVVPVATGSWKIVPGGKGVKLLPPKGQNGPPGVTVLGMVPAAAVPGQPMTVRFRSNLPALVSVTAQAPGGSEVPVLAPRVAGTGEQQVTLPAATATGIYSVTVTADSGPGRVATTNVTPAVNVAPAPGDPVAGDPGDGPRRGLSQSLIAAERTGPERASRSSSVRPVASVPSGESDASDRDGIGVVLAGLLGLAVWRFRARTDPPAVRPD